uniref:Beta-hexosaminidase eukaryotic type N-terminal domain-containing protein n=1 Tax=Pinguiococcus pyrenoidosus TaxID=172671 RepID=A0A7R9YAS6_9STRA
MIKAIVTLAFACLLLEADAFGPPRAARWRMTLGEAPTVRHDFQIVAGPQSIRFGLDKSSFHEVAGALNQVLLDFRAMKEAAVKGERHHASVMTLTTTVADPLGDVSVQLECNPNGYADQFSAKVFAVVSSGHLRTASEVPLIQLVESMKLFKAAHKDDL